MRVFVTGATGFIGTHLCKRLIGEGHMVTALLRSPKKRQKLPKEVKVLEGDLSLFKDEELKLPEFDIVIHLAGVVFADNEAGYLQYNYHAVRDLVECIIRQDWRPKRFLFASSLAAAGPSALGETLTEEMACKPVDPYGLAKSKAEEYLRTVTAFPVTSFRPAIVLGEGDENSITLFKMVKIRFGLSVNGKPQFFSFIDIDDLNAAILTMMTDPSSDYKTYFIAYPEEVSNIKLLRSIGRVMNRKPIIFPLPKFILYLAMLLSTFFSKLFRQTNKLDRKQYLQLINHFVCSGERLRVDLGWKPQYNLQQTLERAYEGYKRSGMI